MKTTYILLLTLFLSATVFTSCQTTEITTPTPTETVSVDENGVPYMTVTYGNTTVQTSRGTYSWDNGNVAIEADSMHPLDASEFLPCVPLVPSIMSHIDPYAAYLQFPMAPDTVEVICWDNDWFGQMDKVMEYTSVEVKPCTDEPLLYEIQLREDGHVYQVIADWDDGGEVTYGFYTAEMVYGEEIPVTE